MEVRPVGVTKGLAMQRLMGLIAEMEGHRKAAFEFVLCIGAGALRGSALIGCSWALGSDLKP